MFILIHPTCWTKLVFGRLDPLSHDNACTLQLPWSSLPAMLQNVATVRSSSPQIWRAVYTYLTLLLVRNNFLSFTFPIAKSEDVVYTDSSALSLRKNLPADKVGECCHTWCISPSWEVTAVLWDKYWQSKNWSLPDREAELRVVWGNQRRLTKQSAFVFTSLYQLTPVCHGRMSILK